jgi:hypothetical protein
MSRPSVLTQRKQLRAKDASIISANPPDSTIRTEPFNHAVTRIFELDAYETSRSMQSQRKISTFCNFL